jgi:hypothetical protein
LPIFRNAHQVFHIFLIIFNGYPWGIYHSEKKKENKLQHSTSCNHFEFLSKLVFGKDGGQEILQGNDNNSNVAQRIAGILETFRAQHPFPELTNEARIVLGRWPPRQIHVDVTAGFHYLFSASCAHNYLTTLPVEHWPNWIPNDHTVRRALKQLNIHFNWVNQKKKWYRIVHSESE